MFAGWLGQQGSLLYLPIASGGRAGGYAKHRAWIGAVFSPLGVADIQMWTELESHAPLELQAFGGVYIGGGNTFTLLHLLRASGFDMGLRRFALEGGAIYGGSAGAIVLGADIASCERDDPNSVGLKGTAALNLTGGADIWCHYRPDQLEQVQTYSNTSGRFVYALPERGGLCIEGDRVRSAGFEACQTFLPSL